jgi:hypothetical protein
MCVFGVQVLNTGESGIFEIMTITFQLRCHCVTKRLQKNDSPPLNVAGGLYKENYQYFVTKRGFRAKDQTFCTNFALLITKWLQKTPSVKI